MYSVLQKKLRTNLLEGGDFMERRNIPGPVGPDDGIDSFRDPRFPKVVGRTREPETKAEVSLREAKASIRPAIEIAETIDPNSGQPTIDRVALFSVTSMDWME